MSETIELQGRAWQARELEQIRQWVEQNPTWSRYRLSRELCVGWNWVRPRSEEDTSELQSRQYLVCRLLLEKKTRAPIVDFHAGKLTLAHADCAVVAPA